MKNKIEDLRNHMFQMLEELSDMDEQTDPVKMKQSIDKAKAMASLGTVIVNSAKTEVDFYKAGGKNRSEFMGIDEGSMVPKKIG